MFRLTYQTVTPKSAEYGDLAHHGFVSRNGNFNPDKNYFPKTPATFRLRDAIQICERHGAGSVQANEYPVTCPRWFDFCREEYGGSITLGLHIPDNVTCSSRMRIARLIGCYGCKGGAR